MRRISIVVTGLALAGSTACTAIPIPVPVPMPTRSATPTAAAAQTGKFGGSIETPNKIKVEFSKPENYPLDKVGRNRKPERAVVFTVTVTNNTDLPLNDLFAPRGATFTPTGGKEVSKVDDVSGTDLTIGVPDLPPGKLTKLRLAFEVGAKPGLLRVEINNLVGARTTLGPEIAFEGEV